MTFRRSFTSLDLNSLAGDLTSCSYFYLIAEFGLYGILEGLSGDTFVYYLAVLPLTKKDKLGRVGLIDFGIEFLGEGFI